MKILNEIQKNLKAPKNQRNNFGNYNYRSCEDILEAVKPLLGEATLLITDEIVLVGDRFYVKATVEISDGKEKVSVSAFARESLIKKGMDESQITGAASSYARKYALNGLFLIDDTKDADTKDNTKDINNLERYQEEINEIKTIEDLKVYFGKNKGLGKDFVKLITIRKQQLQKNENPQS